MKPLPPAAQVAALRIAFPSYLVRVLERGRRDEPRYEAVALNSELPVYCVISTDVREIWATLRDQA